MPNISFVRLAAITAGAASMGAEVSNRLNNPSVPRTTASHLKGNEMAISKVQAGSLNGTGNGNAHIRKEGIKKGGKGGKGRKDEKGGMPKGHIHWWVFYG